MYQGGILTVMVSDFDRAVRFYTETLGLTLKLSAGGAWAEIEAPGVSIGLHAAGEHGPQPGGGGGMSLGLQVDDLEQAMETLKARGVEFAPVMPGQDIRIAFFRDPDGSPLYLWAPNRVGER
ncbi:MAG TPA: VOC family protein [Chloroflexota bacterium]|jgi:catechol 2,3-dioxygenase-like lactoylglutathione lyase family enzyme